MKILEKLKVTFNRTSMTMLFIVSFLIVSLLMVCKTEFHVVEKGNISQAEIDSLERHINYYKYHVYKEKLINSVNEYIRENSTNSKVSGDTIVKYCLKYDISIPFVLAQAQVESHFGTKGVAVRTNSIFNVGTYDNGIILYRYKHPNESIEPYIKLLKNDYLISGKNIEDLMQANNFVNHSGSRYASNIHYEYHVKKTYNKIKQSTRIYDLKFKLDQLSNKMSNEYILNSNHIYLTQETSNN